MKVNPRFAHAMAIAKAIPQRKNKRSAILKWCKAVKASIGSCGKEIQTGI